MRGCRKQRRAPASAPQHTSGLGSGLIQGVPGCCRSLPSDRGLQPARPPSVAGSGTRDQTSKDSGPGTTLNAEALLVPNTYLSPSPSPRLPSRIWLPTRVEPGASDAEKPTHTKAGARADRSSDWLPPLNFRLSRQEPLLRILRLVFLSERPVDFWGL